MKLTPPCHLFFYFDASPKNGIPMVGMYPDMDIKTGQFKGYKVAVPDGPLKDYFEQENVKPTFFNLFRDAVIDAAAKRKEKLDGKTVEASCSVLKTTGISKPPRPVWVLTAVELDDYFTTLKTEIAKEEGVKLRPKWPKIVNNIAVKLPTKIPSFDETVERILPSDIYIPKKKFPLGNHHWRMKLVCAYLLTKYNFDPNTFAQEIPEGYKSKTFSLEALEDMSKNIAASAAASERNNEDEEEEIDFTNDHNDEENQVSDRSDDDAVAGANEYNTEESHDSHDDNDNSFEEEGDEHNIQRLGADPGPSNFLDDSRTTGTPVNSPKGDEGIENNVFGLENRERLDNDDEEDYEVNDDEEEEFLRELGIEMAETEHLENILEESDIRKLLMGQENGQPVLQIYDFKKIAKAKCTRCHAHDGKVATTKVTFSANVDEKIKELIGKMPVIRVTNFLLFNGSFLFIKDFDLIETLNYKLAEPKYLENEDYEELKRISRPNPSLPQTPSMLQKKMTDKNVVEAQIPPRAASQRLKKKKHCKDC